jgi:ACS family sodium-dependent inorganic phosphate cotransporter
MIVSQGAFHLYLNLILSSRLFSASSSFSTLSLSTPRQSTVCTSLISAIPHSTSKNISRKRRRPFAIETCLFTVLQGEKEETKSTIASARETSFFPASDKTIANAIDDNSTDIEFSTLSRSINNDDNYQRDDEYATTMMILIFIVGSLCSLDRVAMSVALVPMSQEMAISDTVKGSISSFFSVGYGLGILPAGLFLSKSSPRVIMAVGICLWSAGTIVTPYSVGTGNMSLLLGARTLVGASESVVIPAVQLLLSNWIAPEKKSFAVGIVYCGLQFGTIIAYSFSPQVIDYFEDWRALFYLYGGAGLLFLVPWLALAKDSPISATINQDNKDMIIDDFTEDSFSISIRKNFDDVKQILMSAPWKDFKQSRGVWAMFFAHAANNWGLYNNLSWTPTFYSEQYGLNVKESAFLLVLPSVVGAIGGLSAGKIADSFIQNQKNATDDDITRVRKVFQGLALLGPAVCLSILASNIPEEPWVAETLFAAAVGMQSFNAAGYGAANQEKAGSQWTGLLYSITSLPSVIVGTFGVYLTGKILDATHQNWSYVFSLNAFIYMLGGIAFVTLYDARKEFD